MPRTGVGLSKTGVSLCCASLVALFPIPKTLTNPPSLTVTLLMDGPKEDMVEIEKLERTLSLRLEKLTQTVDD